jgi:hypothetical protein
MQLTRFGALEWLDGDLRRFGEALKPGNLVRAGRLLACTLFKLATTWSFQSTEKTALNADLSDKPEI